MATKKNNGSKKIVYSEPGNYVPKDIYNKYFKDEEKKKSDKKPTKKKK